MKTEILSPELISLAAWVSQSMREDGFTPALASEIDDSMQVDCALAYVECIGRKIIKMQSTCITTPAVRDGLAKVVHDLLISDLNLPPRFNLKNTQSTN